jgi:hypothetical protein
MILIFAETSDRHADAVEHEIIRKGADVCRLNSDQLHRWRLECLHGEPLLFHDGHAIAVDRIASVFIRSLPNAAEFQSTAQPGDEISAFAAGQRFAQFDDCIRLLCECRPTINTIASTNRAQSKSLQLRAAAAVGLTVPATYLGSDPDIAKAEVRSLAQAGKRACTKPVLSRFLTVDGDPFAGFTELLDSDDLEEIGSLRDCPTTIQEYVDKAYELRIAVMGDRSFACRIDSQAAGGKTAIDWRNYNIPKTPHTACEIPHDVEQRLQAFHAHFGLKFSSFDLIRRRDGEYVFLETNPFGRWLWIEDLAGVPITSALADALIARTT